MRRLVTRALASWRSWRLARRVPAHRDIDRAIASARKAHRPIASLLKAKQQLVRERLRLEIGARS